MNKFITIDFETADYARNSAISIGLVKYNDYQPVDTYYSLIRPPTLFIRPDFTSLHHLTVDHVKDAPDFNYLWDNGICGFLEALPLAAHNAVFDMGVLHATLEHYGIPLPKNRYFCSLALARRTWPHLPSHSLSNLAARYTIVYDAHNALADAQACGKVIALCAETVSHEAGMEKLLGIKDLLRKTRLRMRSII